MFDKTVKGLTKKATNNEAAGPTGSSNAMEIDSGTTPDTERKPAVFKGLTGIELPPIINCERGFWRRTTAPGRQRLEENPSAKHNPELSRVESWVST
jgi:hypothetical protein